MKDLHQQLSTLHLPVKGLLFYRSNTHENDYYVEAYDVNQSGRLTDPHPLSVKEAQQLAEALMTTSRLGDRYLQPEGLFPAQVLYTRTGPRGFAVWYTPPMRRRLVFIQALGLADGEYALPGLIWKADRDQLQLFAMKTEAKPGLDTPLFQAPFFNLHDNGNVCMGTVDISIDRQTCLETFMHQWEDYFFSSRFSHVLGEKAPVKGNIIRLWKSLHQDKKQFPLSALQPITITLSNLIE